MIKMKNTKNINLGHKFKTKDSGKRESYKSGMVRDTTEGKVDYSLVHIPSLKRWAELLTRGAIKYGRNNWQKANSIEEYERFRASAFRHFIQWFSGEEDEDHMAAVFFNLAAAEYVKDKIINSKKKK
jgi:hypothetical protein